MENQYVIAILDYNFDGEDLKVFIKPESVLKAFVWSKMDCQSPINFKFDDDVEDEEEVMKQYWDKVCDDVITNKVKEQKIDCEETKIVIKKITL
nr:MAG TPA: scarabaecin peptide, antimicrobial peptide, beetle [Caudoviricetes sp.]